MESLMIVVGVFAYSVGTILGLMIGTRHLDSECEVAYLSGHVDGYGKAMADAGEFGL